MVHLPSSSCKKVCSEELRPRNSNMDATRRNVGPCKRAALALLIVLTFVAVGIAQDKPATTTAVSNTAAPSLNENPQTKAASEVAPKDKVLTKSSIFFPDLASNREPLTVGGKF